MESSIKGTQTYACAEFVSNKKITSQGTTKTGN